MLANLSLKSKLIALIALSLLAQVLIGAAAYYGLASGNASFESITTNRLPSVISLYRMRVAMGEIRRANLSAGMWQNSNQLQEKISQIVGARKAARTEIDEARKIYDATPQEPEEARVWKEFVAAFDDWDGKNAALEKNFGELIANSDQALRQTLFAQLFVQLDEVAVPFGKAQAALEKTIQLNAQYANDDAANANRAAVAVQWILAIVMTLAILGSVSIGVMVLRSTMRQLGGEPAYVSDVVNRVSEGDFACSITTRADDTTSVMHATRSMVGRLSDMMRGILQQSGQLSDASAGLSAAATQVSEGSSQQSESAASMAAALEQMSTSISHVADMSQEAKQLSQASGLQAAKGGDTIRAMVADINRIVESIQAAGATAHSLSQASERISGVTSVIKDVADQTNLLALNAAIEAARAGEQGRGFAVVADEVRKLAEKTALSAQEIAEMVAAVQHSADTMSQQMKTSAERVDAGVKVAHSAGEAIEAINQSTSRVVTVIDDVSVALQEQSAASQDIANRVESIVQMIEENNCAVASVKETTLELKSLSTSLRASVERFRLAA